MGRIAVRVTDAMYADPFWTARFGARGRMHAEEDAAYHVEYLVQALVARDAEVMRRYARWLQAVLTTRGMCTRHLDESLARVGSAASEVLGPPGRGSAAVAAYVGAAREALSYDEGPARDLQDASDALVARTLERLAVTGAVRSAGDEGE